MNPLVSVIMPVYNAERYLRLAIESILAQSFIDFEMILIDDGSTDDSAAIIKAYQQKDKRIILLQHAQNTGIVSALNDGIGLAKGQFIARMDADDISQPERLKKQVEFLEQRPDVGVLGSWAEIIDENECRRGSVEIPTTHIQLTWEMCFRCPIIHPSVMVRREILLSVGGYRTTHPHAEDYELWVRIAPLIKFANLPEYLLQLRKHTANISVKYMDIQLNNGVAISKMMIRYLTGMEPDITPYGINTRPHPITPIELRTLTQTTLTILERLKALPGITENEKTFLQKATAQQLYFFARQTHPSGTTWHVFYQAFLVNPLIALDILWRVLRKIFQKPRPGCFL